MAEALRVSGLAAGYGARKVVHGIDLAVDIGQVVALVGHNGAGKSTCLKALFGLIPATWSELSILGTSVDRMSPGSLIGRGVGFLPQGSRVFEDLTVKENLAVSSRSSAILPASEDLSSAPELFSPLRNLLHRRAGSLSGGEKQMLALACAMERTPRLLLLDEPSLGLSPALTRKTLGLLRTIVAQEGVAALVVEQKVRAVMEISDHAYVLKRGKISFSGEPAELLRREVLEGVFL